MKMRSTSLQRRQWVILIDHAVVVACGRLSAGSLQPAPLSSGMDRRVSVAVTEARCLLSTRLEL